MQFNPQKHFWIKRDVRLAPATEYFITNSTHQILITRTKRANGSTQVKVEKYHLFGKQLLGPHAQIEIEFNPSGKHLRTKYQADQLRTVFGQQQVMFDPITTPEDIKQHIKPFAQSVLDALKNCKPDSAKHAPELRELYNLLEPHKRTYIDIGATGSRRVMKRP